MKHLTWYLIFFILMGTAFAFAQGFIGQVTDATFGTVSISNAASVEMDIEEIKPLVSSSVPKKIEIPAEYPVRMEIPSLEIDARVQAVGIAQSGSMAVPTNYKDVAWYRHGIVPGEEGNAVFDGHVDDGFLFNAVFKDLAEVKEGDAVYVTNKGGEKLHFSVTKIDSYPYKEVPVEEIFHEAGESRIKLITCAGKWLEKEKTYDTRIVVTAVLVR